MKEIEVIDLIKIIANGEEAPKRIVIRGSEFEYYCNASIERYYRSYNDTNWVNCIDIRPNDKVEIPNEEDKFEDVEEMNLDIDCTTEWNFGEVYDTINQLIKNQKKIIERLKDEQN